MERKRIAPAEAPEDFENVLRLRLASTESASERGRPPRRAGRDGASLLEAVRQAQAEMSALETHARNIEARGVALAERALKELQTAEARIQATEEALRAAEARALEAEARAQEAEDWLVRLNEAIHDGLLSRRKADASAAA